MNTYTIEWRYSYDNLHYYCNIEADTTTQAIDIFHENTQDAVVILIF